MTDHLVPLNTTFEEIENSLSNSVYKAGLWLEKAEKLGYIKGNGHQLAQRLAAEAVKILHNYRAPQTHSASR